VSIATAPAIEWVLMARGPAAGPSRRLDSERLPDHLDRLYRAALMYTGSREDADDLVQETYERVLRRPRFIRSDTDLAYLLRALRNTYLKMQHRRPETHELDAGELVDPRAADPETVAQAHAVLAAVAELPEAYRDVVIAVDVAGLSYRETARALRTREGTVMSRLFRARRRIAGEVG
jgi:RNA polymerase sigma-70 factor (ECF subfamily)